MQNNTTIFESLFNRNFADNGNVDFLEDITAAHPYFSPAQFYLLQKSVGGTDTFEKRALQTNLLFNNAHWLNFQLAQTNQLLVAKENIVEAELESVEIAVVPESTAEIPQALSIQKEITENDVNTIGETTSIETSSQIPEVVLETREKIIPQPVLEQTPKVIEQAASIEEKIQKEITSAFAGQLEELPDNADADNTDAAEEKETNPEIEPMKIELKIPEERGHLQDVMIFEPMHLVDYFASQGIKLSDDILSNDKLGKQLKSFTAWLKTMKKVHVEEDGSNMHGDTTVSKMAEISNAKAEILTEAMAEVLAKQGKLDKASELYQKLSLLNPAKSTYFAAKIENLKEI